MDILLKQTALLSTNKGSSEKLCIVHQKWLNVSNLSNLIQKHFLFQMTEEPTRRGVMLNLVLTNKEGLVQNVKLVGSLGCSDTGMVAFEDLKAVSTAGSAPWAPEKQTGLSRDLFG